MNVEQLVYESTLYIHDNYGEQISIADISTQAYLSPSYFAKVFRVLTGFTVGSYLNHYRMYSAAKKLAESNKRIVEIAFDTGFLSQQSFTKSFSKTYGIAPAQFRLLKPIIPPFPPSTMWKERVPSMELMDCFKNVRFIKKDAYFVVGFEAEINYNSEGGTDPIGGVWDAFNPVSGMIPDKSFDGTYGITHSETNDGKAKYIACVEVSTLANIPTGFVGRKFEASEYAVFDTTLEIIWTGMFYKTLYAKWLPDSGYSYREDSGSSTYEWAPFVKYPAIEAYPKGCEDTKSLMHVYIPIIKK
ncbi:MAG: AraC family transcriptional regulator [Defluviitaleaceae bacterium]|nr:AraC family transcriptional regulator [Defluviitaleaceae bacterium]